MASWKGIHLSFSVFLHCGTWTSENGAVSVIAQQVVVPGVGALHTEHGAPCALGNLPIMDQQWRTAGMAVFLTMKSGLLSTPNPDFFLKTLVTLSSYLSILHFHSWGGELFYWEERRHDVQWRDPLNHGNFLLAWIIYGKRNNLFPTRLTNKFYHLQGGAYNELLGLLSILNKWF